MTPLDLEALETAIRAAWGSMPAPPLEDLQYVEWACGRRAYEAIAGIAPMEVDFDGPGFYWVTLLECLPPRAAAAYIGTYVLGLVHSVRHPYLRDETWSGVLRNNLTYGHLTFYLSKPWFWESIGPFLPLKCREVLIQVVALIASGAEALNLTPQEAEAMVTCAIECAKAPWRRPVELKKVKRKKGWQR